MSVAVTRPVADFSAKNPRTCILCGGAGELHFPSLITPHGVMPEHTSRCRGCDGHRQWLVPDYAEIVRGCLASRGVKQGEWRKNTWREYHIPDWHVRVTDKRIRYVWRLGRWHGGVDTSLPYLEMTILEGDPWLPELDAVAEIAAHAHLGTSLEGLRVWNEELFGEDSDKILLKNLGKSGA